MTDRDLAWVAGVFDARGQCHVTTYRATKNGSLYYRAVVRIESKGPGLLDAVSRIVGCGGIVKHAARNQFVTAAQGGAAIEIRRPERGRFQLQNQTAVMFLRLIRPYVRIKGEAIDAVLDGRTDGAVNAVPMGRLRQIRRTLNAAQKRLGGMNGRS